MRRPASPSSPFSAPAATSPAPTSNWPDRALELQPLQVGHALWDVREGVGALVLDVVLRGARLHGRAQDGRPVDLARTQGHVRVGRGRSLPRFAGIALLD